MGDIRPWTTDTDDIRGSSSRQTVPLMCVCFFLRAVLVSLVMHADDRDDLSRLQNHSFRKWLRTARCSAARTFPLQSG